MTSAPGNSQSQDPELAQCWKDIKDETGFLTYAEYLNAYRDATGGRHDQLAKHLQGLRPHRVEIAGKCTIWDIFGTGTLSNCFFGDLLTSEDDINILKCLRNPASDAILRVILLEPGDFGILHPTSIDVFGLGLRIVPEFFEAYLASSGETQNGFGIFLGDRPGFLGESVVTVARDYLPGMSMCPPVLLIVAENSMFKMLEPPAFDPQKIEGSRWMQLCKGFENSVRDSLKHYQSQAVTLDVALFHSLLPLLQYDLKQLKVTHAIAMAKYLPLLAHDNAEDAMEVSRFKLRQQVRHFEDCMSSFKKCLRDQHIIHLEKYEAFSLFMAESHDSLNAGRALESDIRDWLQLRVGSLALQESKKSIENSNLQIEESKRVKIVTFLAFIYVPLNLATAIFGMNLQQLNRTGQQVWMTIVLYVDYRQWRDEMKSSPEEEWINKERQYNLVIRTAILFLVLKRGNSYRRWLWVSGAWIRILTNERIKPGLSRKFEAQMSEHKYLLDFRDQTTCDYVCQYIRGFWEGSYFDPCHHRDEKQF